MYESFFSLEAAPFVLTPDPRFLLRSKAHHEILTSLLYGITSQKGLMALIGDVGTGKTTLCRALLRELPSDVQSALVLNPHLSEVELLGSILDDLGLARRGTTSGELMAVLSTHVLAAGSEGKTVVVILDEAQNLSVEVLEQIRILSNLETPTRKLLQIVLVGQPELEEKLHRHELRQLDQRVAIRCYLGPLTRKETYRYIEHRLRIAGLLGALPFSRTAMAKIYDHSRGVPRVINLVCDRALMTGYSARAKEVTAVMVKRAIRNLEGTRLRRRSARHSKALAAAVAAVAALALLTVGTAALAYRQGWWPTGGGWSARAPLPPGNGVPASPVMAPTPSAVAPVAPVAAVAPPVPVIAPPVASAPVAPGLPTLLAEALRLWGVRDGLSAEAVRAWPRGPGGHPDIAAVAARHQLSATFLVDTNLTELRAIALPALVERTDPGGQRAYLLRAFTGSDLTLMAGDGRELQQPSAAFEQAWNRTAWVIWWNVDQLPEDPSQDLTPPMAAAVARRLQALGYLAPPVPSRNDTRFQDGVKAFQTSVGLPQDGILGPRTTLALSRAIAAKFGPASLPQPARVR